MFGEMEGMFSFRYQQPRDLGVEKKEKGGGGGGSKLSFNHYRATLYAIQQMKFIHRLELL